jgi:hypothetical protein
MNFKNFLGCLRFVVREPARNGGLRTGHESIFSIQWVKLRIEVQQTRAGSMGVKAYVLGLERIEPWMHPMCS